MTATREPTALPEVVALIPQRFEDDRGWFQPLVTPEDGEALAGWTPFVQVNQSRSHRGVLRGLHLQTRRPQGKLVQVTRGAIFDVAVDLRPGSPAFGQWAGRVLSAANRAALWIPPGFAHGFYALEDSDLLYLVTAPWDPDHELTLLWDDPEVGVDWPLDGPPQVSERDAAGVAFAEARRILTGAPS